LGRDFTFNKTKFEQQSEGEAGGTEHEKDFIVYLCLYLFYTTPIIVNKKYTRKTNVSQVEIYYKKKEEIS